MISVVIPCRQGSDPRVTLDALARQTLQPAAVIVVYDPGKGANWARNRGFEQVQTPFVLFSDDDIEWLPDALERLRNALDAHPEASYAYGAYDMPGCGSFCARAFSADALRQDNYISTMSLIRTEHFSGFDESMQRLQDWDLWLTMLEQGHVGAYCGARVFTTQKRPGITYGPGISWEAARRIVRQKHGLA